MTVFPSLPADDDLLAQLDRDRARRTAAAQRATPAAADRLVTLRRQYPHLQPGLASALAQSNLAVDSPQMEQIAVAAAKTRSKGGLGWHSIGDVVTSAGRVADKALGPVDEAITHVAKPVVRDAALATQSLYEEAQGVYRNVAAQGPVGAAIAGGAAAAALAVAAPVSVPAAGIAAIAAGGAALGAAASRDVEGQARWEPQSSGAIAVERFMHGDRVELGTGWLPNTHLNEKKDGIGSIGAEQTRRAQSVTINGHALTPGRLLTAGVVQPGSKPYSVLSGLVDGSLAMSRFDPASAILKPLGNANRNRKLFVEAGELFANRPQIVPEAAQAWLAGKAGRNVVSSLAADNDFYSIWKATKGKLGAKLTSEVAGADTEQKVLDLLTPHLGEEVRGKFGYSTFQPLSNVRLLGTMPGTHFDPFDADSAVSTIERWLKNAKVDEDTIGKITAQAAGANGRTGRLAAMSAAMDATKEVLLKNGVDSEQASKLTRWQELASSETSAYFKDALYNDVHVPGLDISGKVSPLPSPHLASEFINRTVTLPDLHSQRDIRMLTGSLSKLMNNGLVKEGTAAADFLQGQVWKRTALLRGAYTVRVIGEEQIRMAASGLDSLVNHPLSLIAHRLAEDPLEVQRFTASGRMTIPSRIESAVTSAVQKAGVKTGKAAGDVLGGGFRYGTEDQFVHGLDEFNQALNREFAGWVDTKSRPLPIWKKFTKGEDGATDAWASELLQLHNDPVAREVARNAGQLDDVKQAFWDGNLSGFRKTMAEDPRAGGLVDRAVADRYIDSVLDRVRVKTGGQSDLLDMIGTGRVGGFDARSGVGPTKEFKAYLESAQDAMPDYVKGQLSIHDRGAAKWLDQATSKMFSELMGERTNNLSRSPAFKQFYAQRIEELVPWMDAEAQAGAVQWARSNQLGDVADRIEAAAAKRAKAGDLGLEHIDTIAKGFALDNTKDLLYDMTSKSQFFDASRLIMPFGEAWKEMIGVWSKIGFERPQILARRAPEIITGLRAADPDGDGKGFFYQNERGEEVFNYPGSGWISNKLFGVPVPLTGRVAGLSLMTDVLPGVGPVVQIPAGAFLPDHPDLDWLHNVVFPFGEPDTSHGLVEAFLPAWLQKVRQAGGLRLFGVDRDEQQWNGAVLDVARYLTSTGKYDTSTADGMADLLDDAREKAKGIYLMRGAAQFFAPTAPTPEWMAQDKDGHLVVVDKLIGEYHDLSAHDPHGALDTMFERYGDQIFLLLQGKTAEVTPGPITKTGADWERHNEGVIRSYPNAGGLFAPEHGDLDSAAFDRQVSKGNRVPLTPEQAVKLANGRVANAIYQNAKDKMGGHPNAAQSAWLRQLRGALEERYKGYGDSSGVPEKVTTKTLVDEITKAVEDPRLKDNETAATARVYLEARERAAAAGESPTSFQSAQSMAPMRAWLRQFGELLVKERPEFEPMWSRVFDRELIDDTKEATAA